MQEPSRHSQAVKWIPVDQGMVGLSVLSRGCQGLSSRMKNERRTACSCGALMLCARRHACDRHARTGLLGWASMLCQQAPLNAINWSPSKRGWASRRELLPFTQHLSLLFDCFAACVYISTVFKTSTDAICAFLFFLCSQKGSRN